MSHCCINDWLLPVCWPRLVAMASQVSEEPRVQPPRLKFGFNKRALASCPVKLEYSRLRDAGQRDDGCSRRQENAKLQPINVGLIVGQRHRPPPQASHHHHAVDHRLLPQRLLTPCPPSQLLCATARGASCHSLVPRASPCHPSAAALPKSPAPRPLMAPSRALAAARRRLRFLALPNIEQAVESLAGRCSSTSLWEHSVP